MRGCRIHLETYGLDNLQRDRTFLQSFEAEVAACHIPNEGVVDYETDDIVHILLWDKEASPS